MKPKTDPSTKPYYRCLTCPRFAILCGGRPTRDMDYKNWCEYMRDVMDIKGYTIAYVAEKADVSEKRIEQIRSGKDDHDIKRATARRIEQVIIGPATFHLCDMDIDQTAAERIAELEKKLAAAEKARDIYEKVIERFFEKDKETRGV